MRAAGFGTVAYVAKVYAKARESARKCQLAAGANTAKVCESEGYMARLKLRKWRGPAHVLKLRK